jgi:hypothetical protein
MKKNNLYYFLKRVYYRIVQTVPDKMYAQITYYKCYRKFLDLSNPKLLMKNYGGKIQLF